MGTFHRQMIAIATILSIFAAEPGFSRSVNISSSWLLPQNEFPVFYRHFRDRVTWFEADAVCQFHHAQLVTVESSSQFEAVRAYLKELDVVENVWIGLKRNNEASEFTWTNYQPLARSGYFREDITRSSDPVCVVTDPTAVFKWHTLHCGGPEVASFVCELPVPYWASKSNGCMISMMEGMTVTYLPESPAIQLIKECSPGVSKNVTCKGNMKQSELTDRLTCPNSYRTMKTLYKSVKNMPEEVKLRTTTSSSESDVEDYAIEMATIAQYNDETFQSISKVIGQGGGGIVNLPQEMSFAQEPIKITGDRSNGFDTNGIESAFMSDATETVSTTVAGTTTSTTKSTTSASTTLKPESNTTPLATTAKQTPGTVGTSTAAITSTTVASSSAAVMGKPTTVRTTTENMTTTTVTGIVSTFTTREHRLASTTYKAPAALTAATTTASTATTTTNTNSHHNNDYQRSTADGDITTSTITANSPITAKISTTEKIRNTAKITTTPIAVMTTVAANKRPVVTVASKIPYTVATTRRVPTADTETTARAYNKKLIIPPLDDIDGFPYKFSAATTITTNAIDIQKLDTQVASTTATATTVADKIAKSYTQTSQSPTAGTTTSHRPTTAALAAESTTIKKPSNGTSGAFTATTTNEFDENNWNPTPSSSLAPQTTTVAATAAAAITAATDTAGITIAHHNAVTTAGTTNHRKINYDVFTEHPNRSRHIVRPKQQHHFSYPYILNRLFG